MKSYFRAVKFCLYFVSANRFAVFDDIYDNVLDKYGSTVFEAKSLENAKKACENYARNLDLILQPCPEIELVGFSESGFEVCREFWP